MKRESDKELAYNLKGSAGEAFDRLYIRYWEPLFSFAYKFSGSRALSQDVVQEVFFSLWQKRASVEVNNIEAYLYQSVKYRLFRAYKNKEFPTDRIDRDFENYLVEHTASESSEQTELLRKLLEQLPEKRKEILYLSKYQNLSNAEIAEELNLSTQTVKNQLSRAIKSLRTLLKESCFLFF
ncbi:RNA polymerase sigma-70 factor [Sinomicrobium kalidii]|uniref:RNA polymerase sigma factor n=1 Tax=Sinomicrobium kalidii TaxID=2900738 RepID=UPI001E4117F7|nr:RNA polymerase sigma-70 factor [Sinomicrobium kalidii]UGU15680.1 RNA polymerase sigma-70 factor [Sinomicrobium kalidii]